MSWRCHVPTPGHGDYLPCWKVRSILSNMETSSAAPTPDEAAAALRQADSAASSTAGALRLPSYFYSSIGTATALQIGTASVGVANHNAWGLAVAVAGVVVWV